MKYDIIATLGPRSNNESLWAQMLSQGATAFRLNTSHITIDQLKEWLIRIDKFYSTLETKPPLVLDLQGSKWRLGEFPAFTINGGQVIELINREYTGKPGILPVPHADFFYAAALSENEIVLNDAKIILKVEVIGPDSIIAGVVKGGEISSRKGITYSSSNFRKESLLEKDKQIIGLTSGLSYIRYAVSYLRDAAEMNKYRSYFEDSAYLIAKLERGEAIEDAVRIASYANEIWICRGDLGSEVGIRKMAEAVNIFSDKLNEISLPVIMAGQVLEHMTKQSSPTRSEVCYLYETLLKGYSGFVLSDETAIGEFPLESCRIAAMFR